MPRLTTLVLALSVGAFLPGTARADASCNTLFARLRAAGQPSPYANYVHVLWTTNYFVPSRNQRFMGTTDLALRTQANGDMTATGTRMLQNVAFNEGLYTSYESVGIRIRSDGRMIFNEQYGPYDPICTGDRFVVVHSGDSIEVFGAKAIVYVP
jgi:hypothetical protein